MLLEESPRWCDDVTLANRDDTEGNPRGAANDFVESLRRGTSAGGEVGGTAQRRDDSVLAASIADNLGGTPDKVVDAVEPRWDLPVPSLCRRGLPSTRRGPLSRMSSFRIAASSPSCRLVPESAIVVDKPGRLDMIPQRCLPVCDRDSVTR